MPLQTFLNLPEDKRQKIIDCAVDEFAQHDYQSASVSRMVSQAGISKGSLYQYFSDKRDLYRYILELGIQKKAALMAESMQDSPNITFFETLNHLFKVMATFELQHPKLAKIGYRAANGKSPLPEELVEMAKLSTRHYFANLIDKGIATGEIREDTNVEVTAFLFASALSELGNFLSIKPGSIGLDEQPTDQIVEIENAYQQIIAVIKHGIADKKDKE